MAETTEIAWCDSTFNPWIGCTKVGPGCDNCYAKASWEDRKHRVVWGAGQARSRTKTWGDPVKWNKQHEAFFAAHGRRQRVFCASLADVFDNEVPPSWRVDLLRLIAETPNLDWLLLSKRIGNAHQMMIKAFQSGWPAHGTMWARWGELFQNVWLGATICNQAEADRDIPKLLAIPAAKRFLSMEPLLGPVDLVQAIACEYCGGDGYTMYGPDDIACSACDGRSIDRDVALGESGIDWVIVGGESGPKARPMHPDWARSLRDQCQAASVHHFFKQWGEFAPNWLNDDNGAKIPGSEWVDRMGRRLAGRQLDGREWNEVPA